MENRAPSRWSSIRAEEPHEDKLRRRMSRWLSEMERMEEPLVRTLGTLDQVGATRLGSTRRLGSACRRMLSAACLSIV